MFEFSRPVVEACGQRWPRLRVSGALVRWVMMIWQWLHFRVGLPKPLFEPLAVERLYIDNYFSIAKAERDLGYRPLFTTEQAMHECLPYYLDLFEQMKADIREKPVKAVAAANPAA
jgi:3beta-hydroxy-delta5-steroid dehydrogenase/steroid delta-isomerase